MVSVISVVNSKYSDSKLNIKCARQDGEMVLETFRQLLKDEYDLCTSVCLENIKLHQLENILKVLFQSQREGNTVIVYFSCHGKMDGSELNLLMSDAGQEGKEGYFATSKLWQLCQEFDKNKFLLIFDCCESGGALSLANKKDIEKESNITVISSSSYWESVKYDEKGSKFTIVFCEALRSLDGMGGEITVSNLVKQIKKMNQKEVKCFVNISEGKEDFVILPAREQIAVYGDKFVKTFIERLDNCVAVREMMWYSINDLPNKVKVKIFEKYFEKGCSEASWLVRRAMGNVLSSLDNGSKFEDIVDKFLDSFNWMDKCVGIVAISKSISEKRAQYLKNILCDEHSNIDLVWLADLYLSDSDYHDIQVTINTKLSKSVWGLIEIWDRYSEKYENLFDIISKHIEDKELVEGLSREIILREKTPKGSLASFLYKGEKRGRTIELKKKWLLSLLYGNWRGRIECNLKGYFSNNNNSKIINELEDAKNIPSVERRVSLFEYFENEPKYFEKYKEHIKWGLQDEHPWVRRVAILCFKNYPEEVDKSFEDKVKTDIYPETFAMIINAASITLNNYEEYIKGYGWVESENDAILKAVFRENKRKYM